ncbi:MAG: hypothetical protein PHQ12_10820 [Chthoniobacteraceae bacterium]|nr:hypothetical protein [Chthoniobacteraceae bacterium]
MKLNLSKDQIQKTALAAMVAVGCLFYYFSEMIGPLAERETRAQKEMAALDPKIKKAKMQISRTQAVEKADPHAEEARRVLDAMRAKIPDMPPVAWFPTRLEAFLKQKGIAKPVFRAGTERKDPGIPGFEEASWSIELPQATFPVLGQALAALENQEGLLQITQLQIKPAAKEPDVHYAQITISTLVKRDK